ncbi:Scd6-like Sm domain-containing protein [Lasiosphaeria ovina]|uniref:Scd6-like Sm domain-containing protein n=1 Tax=Lasiosphaeria ovina TaxID=92902 RepID=A0AAE0K8X4_9PEZI|nr:Scd6-like Sm domain-containing protein [Lasiosphaeria ovina]
MSKFLGSRISLISRSDIRYVGTLHQINSEDSTVSLENVRSFGTEGRRINPDDEVAPSDQFYEYIVFRGTDVKDLRVEEGPSSAKEEPPAMPNDPAIVGARARPVNVAPGPPGPPAPQEAPQGLPQGPPQGPPGPPLGGPNQHGPIPGGSGFGYYPPPHMQGWGRAGGPGPGPNPFGGMQYPPQPPWMMPGQHFPPGPVGPAPWNNYAYPPGPGGPPGIPGGPGAPGAPGQGGRQSSSQTPSTPSLAPKPSPIGPLTEKKPLTPTQQADSPSELESTEQPAQELAAAAAPPPPVESKPTEEEVKATAVSLSRNAPPTAPREASKFIPTGPKNISRPTQILPAVPLPVGLTSRASQQAQTSSSKPAGEQINNAEALRDATQAAKAAVAVAMANLAQLDGSAPAQQLNNTPAMDNLTKKVNEMRLNSGRQAPAHVGRGGRGRGPRPAKVEVPDSDFDFASANAKFNKQEIVKEAIAGSPLTETANGDALTPEAVVDASGSVAPAYNPSRSFFDNISSEAKDRLENTGPKPGGREWRGEEQRRNMETFGQGSVDGGFRGFRGGRGRGRGGRGRGYRGRGGNAGYRQHDAQAPSQ